MMKKLHVHFVRGIKPEVRPLELRILILQDLQLSHFTNESSFLRVNWINNNNYYYHYYYLFFQDWSLCSKFSK